MVEIKVRTDARIQGKSITKDVARAVQNMEGTLLYLFTPHTTCGLLINEDADPAVISDIMDGLNRLVPRNHPYKHAEGNADAHIKSSLVGHSLLVPFSGGQLRLGTWQGIFLMEFDGPRERKVHLTVLG
ncbi:MAG TPA: secondary thiamine-phosphate synthase enzyme YjbQ [Syntrophorhabdales bacterium]|nr:secondary thiamine-phosphate synthase enzyme YjbQ [Syntrophorhabdales bacterium]